jgi:4-amino-4-deoxy-L-arabinose transferase-like glycosyltransferase
VLLFFSASSSKLASYILPLFPAAALLVGRQLEQASRALLVVQAGLAALAGAALAVLAPRLPHLGLTRVPAELVAAYAPWLLAAGAVLALLSLVSALLAWRGLRLASVLALSAAGLAFVQLGLAGREALAPAYSAYHAVERARAALLRDAPEAAQPPAVQPPAVQPFTDAPFYVVDAYDHTLPFYLGRTVTMVASRDELSPSIDWEPEKHVADVPRFVELWRAAPKAYAAFRPARFEQIRDQYALEARVLAEDFNLVIVQKP